MLDYAGLCWVWAFLGIWVNRIAITKVYHGGMMHMINE